MNLFAFGLLGGVAITMLIPLYLLILMSFSTPERVFTYPPDLWPTTLTLANYSEALFKLIPFSLFLRNTAIIAALVIVGDLLSCSLVAYGFARFRFPGRDVLFMVLLSTMMVPLIVRLVPLFILFHKIGWINTFLPLVVPAFFGTPLFIFLMRQFFLTIPADLVDAARIDGASELGIWWRIMLPLSRPVLAAVAIFSFQTTWNDFVGPLVFLQRTEVRTVILGLYSLMGMYVEWNLVMAAAVAVVAPMILVFFVFQRFFIKGIVVTGLKG
ncbi:MAG: carbohydrate ABC transporter permease [Dehalococcoidales bacterium]|nr:carbohydrate ABC transporter permease [Dehalococcoidales bacterium]